jgi:hypothetical protein
MEGATNGSSEEELLELRNEGKISEAEYEELLAAVRKPSASVSEGPVKVGRKRLLWIGVASILVGATILVVVLALSGWWGRIDLLIARDSVRIHRDEGSGLHYVVLSIRNEGSGTSGEFRFHLYQGDPHRSQPADHGAGPIKPGGMWNAGAWLFELKEGVNEIVVVLDPHNTVKETDETNNRVSLKVIVQEGRIVEGMGSYSGGESEEDLR